LNNNNIYRKVIFFCILAFLIIVNTNNASAQSPVKQFLKLSCPEKRWVIFHPFSAKKGLEISNDAIIVSKSMKSNKALDGDEYGGQIDAFRHAFWMATLTREIGWRKALRLGNAHEKGNYKQFKKNIKKDGIVQSEPFCRMDYLNNDAGIEIGKRMKDSTLESIVNTIKQMIFEGELYIIHKDKCGNLLDCDSNIINMFEIKGKWFNHICIVPSNRKRPECFNHSNTEIK